MILNVILITKYGIIGAAIASVFGYTVCGIWYLIRFIREYHFSLFSVLIFNKGDFKYLKEKMLHFLHKSVTIPLEP